MIDYKKRFIAYLIDLFILMLILFTISLFVPESRELKKLNNEIVSINEKVVKEEISISQYYHNLSLIIHDIDMENTLISIINAFFIIIYFVIYPFYNNGQTYGQMKLKIKVVDYNNDIPTIQQFMIRNLIINGLLYILLSLSLLYSVSGEYYFTIASFLGIVQLFIVIYSGIMIIYNNDKKGLQDKLSNTFLIEEV